MINRKQSVLAAIAVFAGAMMILACAQLRAAGNVTFVTYGYAALRIDGDPPKVWNLYHEPKGKSNELVLLEWGKRFIRLDVKSKEALEIRPDSITREKNSVVWSGDDSTTKVLPSGEWTFREGRAVQRLHVMLTAESHEIDIDLPTTGK